MAVNLPSPGAANWDVPLNTALATMAHRGFDPSDGSMIAWNFDPLHCSDSTVPLAGEIRMMRLPRVTQAVSVANLHIMRGSTNPVTPVTGQNFAGIYDVLGNRLAVTGDITATLATGSGLKTLPLTSTYAMSPGVYYVAVVQNAATCAAMYVAAINSTTVSNPNLTGANGRFTNGPTGQTSLPTTVSPGSRSLAFQAAWVGIS